MGTTKKRLTTEFLPAERAGIEQVRRQGELFSQNTVLVQFLNAMPNPVMALNTYRQIVFMNRALEKYVNKTPDKILGLRPGEAIECSHSSIHEGGCGTSEFCRLCGAANVIHHSLNGRQDTAECRILLQNGQALDLRVWGTPLIIGEQIFTMFVLADIYDEKKRDMLERLFFHDLLNTAGGIRGFSELLLEADANELGVYRTLIYQLADRLVDEIVSYREINQAERNELFVQWQNLSSSAIVIHAVHLFRNHPVARGKSLVIGNPLDDVSFRSDPTLIGRVIGNLIKNALEAGKDGSTVTVRCAAHPNHVTFSVHNEQYIPRSVQLQIFQRSFTTKGEGRGIGTYSIKLLAERYLRGKVWFASTKSEGTTFFVRFPFDIDLNNDSNSS